MTAKKSKKDARTLSSRKRDDLPDSKFAFAKVRKEPLVDAKHVRNAIARFDQVKDVSDKDRDRAWQKILKAAKKYDVKVDEDDWRDLVPGKKQAKKVKRAKKSEKPMEKAPKKKSKSKSTSSAKKGKATKVKHAEKSEKPMEKAPKRPSAEPDTGH